jgi:predicted RND superfamily exporter protein
MKRFIFITSFALIGLTNLKAQTSFSCNYRQYCYWSESTKNYQNCKGFDENSIFVISKDEKAFTHEIESMKSTYSINEKVYDKETDTWTYQVTSNEGHKYTYTFDPTNKEVRFVPKKDEKTVMQIFSIKAIY